MTVENLRKSVATIASSATTSDAIDLEGLCLVQIQMPAAFTGASITFTSSHDGVTYQSLYNSSNTQYSITVAASRNYNIAPSDFAGCRFLKIVSASSEAASRSIGLIARECD